jgi:hypothetical protein
MCSAYSFEIPDATKDTDLFRRRGLPADHARRRWILGLGRQFVLRLRRSLSPLSISLNCCTHSAGKNHCFVGMLPQTTEHVESSEISCKVLEAPTAGQLEHKAKSQSVSKTKRSGKWDGHEPEAPRSSAASNRGSHHVPTSSPFDPRSVRRKHSASSYHSLTSGLTEIVPSGPPTLEGAVSHLHPPPMSESQQRPKKNLET